MRWAVLFFVLTFNQCATTAVLKEQHNQVMQQINNRCSK